VLPRSDCFTDVFDAVNVAVRVVCMWWWVCVAVRVVACVCVCGVWRVAVCWCWVSGELLPRTAAGLLLLLRATTTHHNRTHTPPASAKGAARTAWSWRLVASGPDSPTQRVVVLSIMCYGVSGVPGALQHVRLPFFRACTTPALLCYG
jgi:hypothetical protein